MDYTQFKHVKKASGNTLYEFETAIEFNFPNYVKSEYYKDLCTLFDITTGFMVDSYKVPTYIFEPKDITIYPGVTLNKVKFVKEISIARKHVDCPTCACLTDEYSKVVIKAVCFNSLE